MRNMQRQITDLQSSGSTRILDFNFKREFSKDMNYRGACLDKMSLQAQDLVKNYRQMMLSAASVSEEQATFCAKIFKALTFKREHRRAGDTMPVNEEHKESAATKSSLLHYFWVGE